MDKTTLRAVQRRLGREKQGIPSRKEKLWFLPLQATQFAPLAVAEHTSAMRSRMLVATGGSRHQFIS